MRTHLVAIGNSRGVRIPKTLLSLCHIQNEVDMNIKGDSIVIIPVRREVRSGWDEQFKKMSTNNEDQLLINDAMDFDSKDWQW